MNFTTFHLLGISEPQLTNSMIFQRGRYTTNQMGIIDEWFISIFGDSYDFFWDLYWLMEGIYNQSIYNKSEFLYIFDIWLIILGIHGGLYRELIYELMGIDGNCDGTLWNCSIWVPLESSWTCQEPIDTNLVDRATGSFLGATISLEKLCFCWWQLRKT